MGGRQTGRRGGRRGREGESLTYKHEDFFVIADFSNGYHPVLNISVMPWQVFVGMMLYKIVAALLTFLRRHSDLDMNECLSQSFPFSTFKTKISSICSDPGPARLYVAHAVCQFSAHHCCSFFKVQVNTLLSSKLICQHIATTTRLGVCDIF